jgi:hypothetical protein
MFGTELVNGRGRNIALFWGAFIPNGAGAVDPLTLTSAMGVGPLAGFTVARTATGVFTITLLEPYPFLVNLQVTGTNLGNQWVEPRTPPGSLVNSNAGRNILIASKSSAGTDTDLASQAGRWVEFLATFRTKVATL